MNRVISLIPLAVVFGAVVTGQENKAQDKAEPPAMRHAKTITGLAFSPDGKTLASASDDETVRLWDVKTGEELRQWVGHRNRVSSVAISADGKMVASGDEKGRVFLWDIGTGKIVEQFEAQRGVVQGLAFVPRKGYLATSDNTVTIWKVPPGIKVKRFQRERLAGIASLAYSSCGSLLATGALDGSVFVWGVLANEKGVIRPVIVKRYNHPETCRYVAMSSDGKWLASGGEKALILWDREEGTKLQEWKGEVISNIVFTPDGKTMIACMGDATKFWDVATKKEVRALPWGRTASYAIALSPDGKLLATGGFRERIFLWDVTTGKEVRVSK